MNITVTFRHMDASDSVKSYATEKIKKLQKFLRQAMTAQVTLSAEGTGHVADVRINAGPQSFHGTERRDTIIPAIDLVLDKLERQIHDAKAANVANKHGGMKAAEFAVKAEQEAARESQRGTR